MKRRQVLVTAMSLLLAALVVRGAAVGALVDVRPDLALAISASDPEALIGASGYDPRRGVPATPAQSDRLLRAAAGDPLYPEPYLARAAAMAAQGQDVRAIALGQAALAREPRLLATHGLLLREYARVGDLPRAIATMNSLASLSGEVGPALAGTIAKVAEDPRGARVVAAALRSNPRWRSYFVRQTSGPGASLAFETLVHSPDGVSETAAREDRASFLSRLVQAGDYQRAYLAWVNFLPPARTGDVATIYDGDFAGNPGLEPFNWSLIGNEAATAERRADSALPGHRAVDVNFFGNAPATIATQTLLAAPGAYRFTMVGELDAGGQFAGALRWQMTCLPGQSVIPLATLNRFDGRVFRLTHDLVVPARGCEAQQLALLGDPGEVATLIHAQFTGLALTPR